MDNTVYALKTVENGKNDDAKKNFNSAYPGSSIDPNIGLPFSLKKKSAASG